MIESDRELSTMVQELWDNDVNRLKPGKDYRISLQVHHTHDLQHLMCSLHVKHLLPGSFKHIYKHIVDVCV